MSLSDNKWHGTFAGSLLPLDRSQIIDWVSLEGHLRTLSSAPIQGIFVNANIGEGPYMSDGERDRVLEFAVKEVGGEASIIGSVLPTSTRDAMQSAERSREAGADALLVFPHPAFADQPLDASLVLNYYQMIGVASGLPLVAYQPPAASGMRLDTPILSLLVGLDEVVAVKEGSWDVTQYKETSACLKAAGSPAALLADGDNILPDLVKCGADGATISCAVIVPELWAQLANGSASLETSEMLVSFAELVFAQPFWSFRARLKAVLREAGEFSTSEVRLPNRPIGSAETDRLVRAANRLRQASLIA